jgi:chemotaxis protein MotB
MQQVANVILNIPNKVSISGHTDANPYRTKNYSNWELSSDRANASRRVLEEDGINATRFASVVGKESKEHFNTKDPLSAQNRRISIILLRQQQKPKTLKEETIKENKP